MFFSPYPGYILFDGGIDCNLLVLTFSWHLTYSDPFPLDTHSIHFHLIQLINFPNLTSYLDSNILKNNSIKNIKSTYTMHLIQLANQVVNLKIKDA